MTGFNAVQPLASLRSSKTPIVTVKKILSSENIRSRGGIDFYHASSVVIHVALFIQLNGHSSRWSTAHVQKHSSSSWGTMLQRCQLTLLRRCSLCWGAFNPTKEMLSLFRRRSCCSCGVAQAVEALAMLQCTSSYWGTSQAGGATHWCYNGSAQPARCGVTQAAELTLKLLKRRPNSWGATQTAEAPPKQLRRHPNSWGATQTAEAPPKQLRRQWCWWRYISH